MGCLNIKSLYSRQRAFLLGDCGDCGRRRTADRALLYILGPLAALIAEVRGPWTA